MEAMVQVQHTLIVSNGKSGSWYTATLDDFPKAAYGNAPCREFGSLS